MASTTENNEVNDDPDEIPFPEELRSTSSENRDDDHNKVDSNKAESEKGGDNNGTDEKKENEKNESDKEGDDKDDSDKDESEEEEEMGLLDRPVEVTGCRARKQVERLEVSFALPTKDKQIPEGRGAKLGECPRIEFQIAKHAVADLKPLHRILFNRQGTANDTKRNIRKFSGFPFEENSSEFKKNKAKVEKYSSQILKKVCEILDLERSGTKDDIINRILQFLICPSDSGKALPKKKSSGRDKKTATKKKGKSDKKSKAKSSEEEGDDEVVASNEEVSDASTNEEETSDVEPKKKSKAKSKKTPIKVKTVKKEKPKKEAKGLKRKNVSDSSDEDSKPVAKKAKLPDDDEIQKLVQTILEKADLHEITMKKVIKQVYDTYPDVDLTDKKSLIKKTIKTVLQLNEKGEER